MNIDFESTKTPSLHQLDELLHGLIFYLSYLKCKLIIGLKKLRKIILQSFLNRTTNVQHCNNSLFKYTLKVLFVLIPGKKA